MGVSNCQTTPRIVSPPSKRSVPDKAPKWAVKDVEDILDDTTAALQNR